MMSNYVVYGMKQTMPNAGFVELMAAVLTRGAPFRFQANGFSMSPFIRDGDVITIAPPPARLCLGDVVAFVNPSNEHLIVHRIVHTGCHGYLIRGDNVPEPDGYVSRADVLGRVIRVERRGRRVWLGLGFERVVIAFLSRRGWIVPLWTLIWRSFHFFIRRSRA